METTPHACSDKTLASNSLKVVVVEVEEYLLRNVVTVSPFSQKTTKDIYTYRHSAYIFPTLFVND